MYTFDFSVVLQRWPDLVYGTIGTLGLALVSSLFALLIGVLGVVGRRSSLVPLRWMVRIFVEVIRNTPFLVQIFFIFFALPLLGLRLNPTVTALMALSLNGGAYAIEIIRGGVESVPRGQIEAGYALGLHQFDVFRMIVLKPALRAIYPSLTSQFVMLTLATSICSAVSAYELTSVAQRIDADTFRSFEVYFTITAIYLAISWLVMMIFANVGRVAFRYPMK
jgi:polar amino acid transport system permease protein